MAGVLSFSDALDMVRTHARKLPRLETHLVELAAACGRVLAEDVTADRDQPPFNRSTRDGFAVHADDWSSGKTLRLVGQLRAGEIWQGEPVGPGSAIEIMTGAPVPEGADSVAMIEHAEIGSHGFVGAVSGRTLTPGENIVKKGIEAHAGEVLIPTGTELGPAEVAIAAACGWGRLSVYAKPGVAIVATGDELVDLCEIPAPHQIRNSNSYGIAALISAAGAAPTRLETARDDREQIRERILEGRRHDLLLLSGGVSAGKYDLVEEVLASLGSEFLFTGVKMQPGKPLVFGRLPSSPAGDHECYLFGLPGNPVSTQVTFHCFVEPFLRALAGAPWSGPRFAQATLSEDVAVKHGVTRVLPGRLLSAVARPEVSLVPWHGSGDLAANARANCYVALPEGSADFRAGEVVTILLR